VIFHCPAPGAEAKDRVFPQALEWKAMGLLVGLNRFELVTN
jgi:hypothetical protein